MAVRVPLSDEPYQKIELLKNRPDESDEEIISAIPEGHIDPDPMSDETLERVRQAREDCKAGKCQTIAEVTHVRTPGKRTGGGIRTNRLRNDRSAQ